MTPTAEATASVPILRPPTDVVQFSSALTYASRTGGAQWLVPSASTRDIELPLPDGTCLSLAVKMSDDASVKPNKDFITIHAWIKRRLIDGAAHAASTSSRPMAGLLRTEAFPLSMQCLPPKPRFKTSDEEPDDNSLAMRSTRWAFANLDTTAIDAASWTIEEQVALVWVQLYMIVSILPAEEAFNVALAGSNTTSRLADALLDSNLAIPHPGPPLAKSRTTAVEDGMMRLICMRSSFWQSAYPFKHVPWLSALGGIATPINVTHAVPAQMVMCDNVFRPRRPHKPTAADGPIYTRHILELGQTLTFEAIDADDAEFVRLFTKWQNEPRVASGWRQRGTEAEQQRYLAKTQADGNMLGLVGKWDGEPWGYVEVYWARESNIGAFFDAGAYDRGFHALVGEQRFRGPHRVRSWMGSVMHMLFALDARTERVVLEPRASNHVMINYATMCGGHVAQLIDLPHKRAALVVCPRQGFFQLCPLGPLTKQQATARANE